MIQIKYPWLRGRAPVWTEIQRDFDTAVEMQLSFWDDCEETRTLVYRERSRPYDELQSFQWREGALESFGRQLCR